MRAAPGLAIIAGSGDLPRRLAAHCAATGRVYRLVLFGDRLPDWAQGAPVLHAEFEKPGRLFAALREAGCRQVAFAGGMARPQLNPLRFDATLLRHAPRILPALRGGDDAALRVLADVIEREGFEMVAAQDILPDLMAAAGVASRARPDAADAADADRAERIVAALGAVDVGQAAVVAQGICLGVESIQGTDLLLDFVARTGEAARPDPDGARGVLFKGMKPGQDRRLDVATIGPRTVEGVAAAGLAGIVLRAGGAQILEPEETVAAADREGIFLWVREEA